MLASPVTGDWQWGQGRATVSRDDTTSGAWHFTHAPSATPGVPRAICARAAPNQAESWIGVNAASKLAGWPSAPIMSGWLVPHATQRTGIATWGGSPRGSEQVRQRARARGMTKRARPRSYPTGTRPRVQPAAAERRYGFGA